MAFATFPEFTTLTLKDREEYEELIKDFPPVADISFSGLMGWWGVEHPPKISLLNGNIVILYFLRTSPNSSGYSLIGVQNVDESLCVLLDYIREHGERTRLVHVPEFVILSMEYPELFSFRPERNYDEYIISLSSFYPLEQSTRFQRNRVLSFMEKVQDQRVQVEYLDLGLDENRKLLLECFNDWPPKGINKLTPKEEESFRYALEHGATIGLRGVGLKISGQIEAFILFQAPVDKSYITLEYMKVSYARLNTLHFAAYMFAEWFACQDVKYINLCMDYGKPILRVTKLALQPVNFFRKYTIEPQGQAVLSAAKVIS